MRLAHLPKFVCATLLLTAQLHAQEDDELSRGLIGRYRSGDKIDFERNDESLAFDWTEGSPDIRLPIGPFSVTWRGLLMSQARGEYRIAAYASGRVEIKLNGETLLASESDRPAWHLAKPVELPFDWHPIEIQYDGIPERSQIALFWSGPQFDWEPISARSWFHEPDQTPGNEFERGHQISRALRCAACHELPEDVAIPAPSLKQLAGNLNYDWLVDWLTSKPAAIVDGQLSASRRMPHFDLSQAEAEAIASYLFANSEMPAELQDSPEPKKAASKPKKEEKNAKTKPWSGEQLFLSLGCLACHQNGELGAAGLFDGGNLALAHAKRPRSFFARWLADPATINPNHRMPVFDLSDDERARLADWLANGDQTRPQPDSARPTASEMTIALGRQLVTEARCGACHELPGKPTQATPISLRPSSNWDASCINARNSSRVQPHYKLTESDTAALQAYTRISAQRASTRLSSAELGRQRLVENNCIRCHSRALEQGIAPHLPAVAANHGEFEPLLPAMTPPSLNSVGDKLHDSALEAAIRRRGVHRPYLMVRMPRFRLTDNELRQLVEYFVAADRIPDGLPPRRTPEELALGIDADPKLVELAGARLVTTDGFGCTSCHRVGDVEPPPGPLNARGPSISMLSERIRRPWYDRWVRNPARIVPQMEMPSVQLPVNGILNDDVDAQLAAVWQVLNQPGFQPPAPNALRVVRRAGIRERAERAVLLTDVLRADESVYLKPALIGLPNRHNVLFDLATGRLDRWWIGDAARQRTEGKSWYWEAGANSLRSANLPTDEIVAIDASGEFWTPQLSGQFVTELDGWEHRDDGRLVFRHRLHLGQASDTEAERRSLSVEQSFMPIWDDDDSHFGFRRAVAIGNLTESFAGRMYVGDTTVRRADVDRAAWLSADGAAQVRVVEPADALFMSDAAGVYVAFPASRPDGLRTVVLEYTSKLPIDRFPQTLAEIPPPAPTELNVVPGFEAVRLPFADELMPTGLAWRPNGELAITSLKGRVWLARDTDGDGLEDNVAPFSDELAAPYGIAAHEDAVDVITKYALLRVFDDDRDGQADRAMTLASGWGHTADYHDWAVGLPSDGEGGYFVAFPCQQDKRSKAAAKLRGEVVRLVPRSPSLDDPRLFSIQPISGGHRFPMGLARSRLGELFVTDNQGNYNPFNELNHVVPGARFGFINANERRDGFNPPLTPPAVNLPHPWTRSVNGICFLETPDKVRNELNRDLFGPFEGHLIGCEYDTRRLIRISLQRVGETYQGAAYPFSYDQPTEGEPLLGPLCCAVAPDGDLYVGNIRDSGWGGANNIGTLVRLRPASESLPIGIAEMIALPDGFEIRFTSEFDALLAADRRNYSLVSYTRVSTPAYGGPDVDHRKEPIQEIGVARNRRSVRLRLASLRPGYVYELHVQRLIASGEFFPDEAHYSLNQIP